MSLRESSNLLLDDAGERVAPSLAAESLCKLRLSRVGGLSTKGVTTGWLLTNLDAGD